MDTTTADIAIIGMACRFPDAAHYEEYWKNLQQARSCIREVPPERWDWKKHWGDPASGKSISKWGGFLDNADCFDAAFFNHSGKEAESMDPQQRIMLELSWACLEDAGIRPSRLYDSNTGVYVAAFSYDYKELQERAGFVEAHHATGTSPSIISNRISYYYNFHGPSLSIDTACSGSLQAIHLAAQALQQEECDLALAGGINLLFTPTRYISLSKAGMLSPTGACKTFDDSADGYVRSEGAGFVLLKSLKKALKDGDRIYGILKGTAVNHGGKAHTLSYPKPEMQAGVIMAAMKRAGVTPDTINYVELHGTGTPKGDPIEFSGLVQAFGANQANTGGASVKGYCGLGAVKANIGHLEPAAGIAGLIKVLLAMKYRQLPPLVHFNQLNHRIRLQDSPFYIVDRLQEWQPLRNETGAALPRRAGVSSFGFGGTNAHAVLEEAPAVQQRPAARYLPRLICLSGKTTEALRQKISDMATWLDRQTEDPVLADISYTLLAGREHFEQRVAFIAGDIATLKDTLQSISGRKEGKKEPLSEARIAAGDSIIQTIFWEEGVDESAYADHLSELAKLYEQGYDGDWAKLFRAGDARLIGLPAYPFAKTRYWIPADASLAVVHLHPLLHEDTATSAEPRFTSVFSGQEHFLRDHVIKGRPILPGVAYLEMVREAMQQAYGRRDRQPLTIRIKNVVWMVPFVAGDQRAKLHIGLEQAANGQTTFEIYTKDEAGKKLVHSQGTALSEPPVTTLVHDLKRLHDKCPDNTITRDLFYAALREAGFEYGPAHQAVERLYIGPDEVLAKLSLPEPLLKDSTAYTLHPGFMDAALQATMAWQVQAAGNNGTLRTLLPFALEDLQIYDRCTADMYAVIRYSPGSGPDSKVQKMDIDLCDANGKCCVRMNGYCGRLLERETPRVELPPVADLLQLRACWEERAGRRENAGAYNSHVVILCEAWPSATGIIGQALAGVHCRTLQADEPTIEERFTTYGGQLLEAIQQLVTRRSAGNVLLQLVVPAEAPASLLAGLRGLLQTAMLEYQWLSAQLIEWPPAAAISDIAGMLLENARYADDQHIRYSGTRRLVKGWQEIEGKGTVTLPWRPGGVYLITGGAGGLATIFAKEIVSRTSNVTLILTGRSALPGDKQEQLTQLQQSGATVVYRQTDISDEAAVNALLRWIKITYGQLHGILHCAGMIRDNFLIRKTREELRQVLAPKVPGLVYLDEASQDMPLDFFVLFSSVSAIWGIIGQADYSLANAFMDEYAFYRNGLARQGKRKGRTISINWPYWREGGMQVDAASEKILKNHSGMIAMSTQAGINALYTALDSGADQMLAVQGDTQKAKKILSVPATAVEQLQAQAPPEEAPGQLNNGELKEKVSSLLIGYASEILKIPAADIRPDEGIDEYGFDSILYTEFTNRLNDALNLELPPTIFFECASLEALADHLIGTWPAVFAEKFPSAESLPQPAMSPTEENSTVELVYGGDRTTAAPVAIIGMSGRFPMADDIAALWKNLLEEKDCITEIPPDRWDWKAYYGNAVTEPGKTRIKWGGFIDDLTAFDPSFFNISPGEATYMDPQQRLLMMYVWKAIEDAGYAPQGLSGSDTAIFVGMGNHEYSGLFSKAGADIEGYTSTGIISCVGPNRMSYFLNLHGPSEPVDTACSSSLVAIHRAVQMIQSGDCNTAIAGGISALLTPQLYISFNKAGMLSENGRCHTFSDQANGYVRGEGVGMILLKRLEDAERDGDHIYGVIRSSAENHGGRANSLTAPNMHAQAALLKKAYSKAGVDPRTVTYIEAHGTGTKLGDPIEINALKAAFRELYKETGDTSVTSAHCGLGSVKSNIGHLEYAAGIAGVIKVLLQLQHRTLIKSLHSETINPYIELKDSPFYVVRQTQEWKALRDASGMELPRRAGISSFGFGGVNAHVVIEEYQPAQPAKPGIMISDTRPGIFVLSAKNGERLHEQVVLLLKAMDAQAFDGPLLADLAYTLQVGRNVMEERLAIIAGTAGALKSKLQAFVAGVKNIDALYHDQVKKRQTTLDPSTANAMQETISVCITNGELDKLAEYWTKGYPVNWQLLYSSAKPRRISLPTYPFAREHYRLTPESTTDDISSPSQLQENIPAPVSTPADVPVPAQAPAASTDPDKIKQLLIRHASNLLKIKEDNIDLDTGLDEYGFDSVLFTQFANELNEVFGLHLAPVIFFEHSSLGELAAFLQTEFGSALAAAFPAPASTPEVTAPPAAVNQAGKQPAMPAASPGAIAIIGMSGRFPMAKDLHEFWVNLQAGKDCITEIPAERWDSKLYPGAPKWGGFIEGMDTFDPFFFNISPAEAIHMDPQQRLLMMYVWKAIEDAGYAPQSLSGSNTGIFTGITGYEYNRLLVQAGIPAEGYSTIGMMATMGPNRMSYFLDIHGPSEPIETACSSSLVAIHRAVEAIQSGACDMAVAGGVNTLLTPEIYDSLARGGMLSPDGRCKTFSDSANGYVRAEGVGMLLLKRLENAERDGDHIYGIIRSAAVNHGGRANSLTAPNPRAQVQLLLDAYRKAGIDPRTVTYLEAHGTGTPLGDPIEISALKNAFSELYETTGTSAIGRPHCGLGSVKTNIGHLEIAAGIAGVIKVLLQLQHKTLVKSLHSEKINPYIQLDNSPFYIVPDARPWEALQDETGNVLPRRAGVSSFGFGGVNAHVVIEEYIPAAVPASNNAAQMLPVIVVLTARDRQRLQEYAQHLAEAVRAGRWQETDLQRIAYTLQESRSHMEERVAIIVSSLQELLSALEDFIAGKTAAGRIYQDNITQNKKLTTLLQDEDLQASITEWIAKKKYEKLAELWVKGLAIEWSKLYGPAKPGRISLPTYPFAAKRYWIPAKEVSPLRPALNGNGHAAGHPVQVTEGNTGGRLLEKSIAYFRAMLQELLLIPEEDISADVPVDQYGVDSIIITRLMGSLRKVFTGLESNLFSEYPTIRELAAHLMQKDRDALTKLISPGISARKEEAPFREVVRLNNSGQGRPVFWIHPIGGGIECYQVIAQKSERPFYGIAAGGWPEHGARPDGLSALAAYYIRVMRSVQPEGPYDLGGYSLGGALAYEMARQLQEAGETVKTIVMLDTIYVPGLMEKFELPYRSLLLQTVNLLLLAKSGGEPDPIAAALIHRNELTTDASDRQFLEQITALARSRGLQKTAAQLDAIVQSGIQVQQAAKIPAYRVLPLRRPDEIRCYYFRNGSRSFYGELAPYCIITPSEDIPLDGKIYWEALQDQLPQFHLTALDTPNHITMLNDPHAYKEVLAVCEKLYGQAILSPADIEF